MQPSCGIGSSWFGSALTASVAEIKASTALLSRLCWDFIFFSEVFFVVVVTTKLLDVNVGAEWKQSKGFNQCVDKCLGQVSDRVLGNLNVKTKWKCLLFFELPL